MSRILSAWRRSSPAIRRATSGSSTASWPSADDNAWACCCMRGLSAMELDTIAGNERARAFLSHAVRQDAPAHAYLLVGPAGVGKTATALAFAADLLATAGAPLGQALHPDLLGE